MKITTTHIRLALAIITVSAVAMVLTMLLHIAPMEPLPRGLDTVLPIVLAIGSVLVPMIGLFSRLAEPNRLSSVVFFILPLFSFASFLAPQLDVFPLRILCLVGAAVSFVGVIVVLFNALEQRPHRSRPAPSRFDS